MRLLRVAVCMVVLSCPILAQTTGQQPSGSNPQDPNAPSAPQQNPLEEPKKLDPGAELPQSRRPSDFGIGKGDTSSGQDQILGEVHLMLRNTDIGGDASRSFRTPGINDLGEFNLFSDQRFLLTHRVQVLSMYRGTNDPSIDPEVNSLQKAYVRIYGKNDDYVFGDALVSYSRLTFNQNIKGVSASWQLGDKWSLQSSGGVFTDRWGSLWKPYQDNPSRPFTAIVSGVRAAYKATKNAAFGFNFSSSNDLSDSLPNNGTGVPPLPATNYVGSFDGNLQFRNARLEGEFAYSDTDFDERANIPMKTDWGARLEGSYRHQKLALRGSYVRYQPLFTAINARQINDLQDWIFRAGYEITNWMTVEGTARRSNNDLDHQLASELVTWGPEGRFIFQNLPFNRRMVIETGYRQRLANASDDSVNRSIRMPYAEMTLPYRSTFVTVGWELRNAIDYVNPSQTSNTQRIYGSLRGMYEIHGWHINPMGRYEFERGSQRPQLQDVPPIFRLDYDTNRLATAMLYVESPKWFITELGFRCITQTIYNPAGPGGNNRPAYHAALTYKINNDENMLLTFSYDRNFNYYYLTPSFYETVYGASLVWKFGKRGR